MPSENVDKSTGSKGRLSFGQRQQRHSIATPDFIVHSPQSSDALRAVDEPYSQFWGYSNTADKMLNKSEEIIKTPFLKQLNKDKAAGKGSYHHIIEAIKKMQNDGRDLPFLQVDPNKQRKSLDTKNFKPSEVDIDIFAAANFKKLIGEMVKNQYEKALKSKEKIDGLQFFLDQKEKEENHKRHQE